MSYDRCVRDSRRTESLTAASGFDFSPSTSWAISNPICIEDSFKEQEGRQIAEMASIKTRPRVLGVSSGRWLTYISTGYADSVVLRFYP